jgi:hypothetical protein
MLYQPPGELAVTEGAVDRLLRDMRVADSDLRSSNGYPGVLHFGSGSSAEPWLVLSYVEHMGWFIEFCGRVNGRDESFNPVSGDDYGSVGRAWTGDTWWVIPVRSSSGSRRPRTRSYTSRRPADSTHP